MKRIVFVFVVVVAVCFAIPVKTANTQPPPITLFGGDCGDWDSLLDDARSRANSICAQPNTSPSTCQIAIAIAEATANVVRREYVHGMLDAFGYAGYEFKATDMSYINELDYYCRQRDNRRQPIIVALIAVNDKLKD